MKYLDFKKGQRYEVLANPAENNPWYHTADFQVGSFVIFLGSEEIVYECATILKFDDGENTRSVKFGIDAEPNWEKYFREV